jgi:hypothetical protein
LATGALGVAVNGRPERGVAPPAALGVALGVILGVVLGAELKMLVRTFSFVGVAAEAPLLAFAVTGIKTAKGRVASCLGADAGAVKALSASLGMTTGSRGAAAGAAGKINKTCQAHTG